MELEQWLQAYLQMVQALFGERICCVGLQGSYGRGEAGADSDIDIVLILDPGFRCGFETLPAGSGSVAAAGEAVWFCLRQSGTGTLGPRGTGFVLL